MDTATIKEYYNKFHNWISGAPNVYISAALTIVGIFAIFIALIAPPELKATILAWMVLP